MLIGNLRSNALCWVAVATASASLGACQYLMQTVPGRAPAALETHQFELSEDVVGNLTALVIKEGDTLPDIARHYGLGHEEINAANPDIDPWLPQTGRRVLLPLQFVLPDTPRQGVVLNLASMRLFHYFEQPAPTVITYPIGIGRQGWNTPTGRMHIIEKITNPVWRVPASIRREHARKGDPLPAVVEPGPDNPLGEHAVRLSLPSYLIHGTNKPYGVGMRISHGCVRLYPEDMRALFPRIEVGTKVRIVNQPYLVGWRSGLLYLEAHQPLQSNKHKTLRRSVIRRIARIAEKRNVNIDWDRVDQVLSQTRGIPEPVTVGAPSYQAITNAITPVARPTRFHGSPTLPEFRKNAWYVEAGVFTNARPAKRLAAMLNHQGPQIPAHVVPAKNQFQILAGPYSDKQEAQEAAQRIGRDLQLKTRVAAPDSHTGTH